MPHARFLELFRDPPVYVINAGSEGGLQIALNRAGGRPCHVLLQLYWTAEGLKPAVLATAERLRTEAPQVQLVTLTATAGDARDYEQAGLAAIHAHHNAFIDERLFYPELGAPKTFDAVHNAQTGDFKRHELAYDLPNLALVTYDEKQDVERIAELVRRYRNLALANWSPDRGHRWVHPPGLRQILSRSWCGLVLSEVEGGNRASGEYLLCGIPVVSTPSRGGRDELFDPRHVRIVDPTPEAVMAAVAELKGHGLDPLEIREAVLARMYEHRKRLIAWLSQLLGRDLARLAGPTHWLPQFQNNLGALVQV